MQIEICPVCERTVNPDEIGSTSYYEAGFEGFDGQVFLAPDEVHLHVECDAYLTSATEESNNWTDAITAARELRQKGNTK